MNSNKIYDNPVRSAITYIIIGVVLFFLFTPLLIPNIITCLVGNKTTAIIVSTEEVRYGRSNFKEYHPIVYYETYDKRTLVDPIYSILEAKSDINIGSTITIYYNDSCTIVTTKHQHINIKSIVVFFAAIFKAIIILYNHSQHYY